MPTKTKTLLTILLILAGVLLTLQMPAKLAAQEPQTQEPQTQEPAQAPEPSQAQEPAEAQEPGQAQEPAQAAEPGQDAQAAGQDPPSVAARLSYSTGSVSFQPGGEGDWVTAVVNRPLTSNDNLWADKDSRAEFQIGSTSIRMDSETSVTFLQLDDRTTQLRLSQGSLIFRVRHIDDEDHFEIDTPNSAFVVQRSGEYRIDVNADGSETDTTVFQGRAEVTGGGDSYVVVAGQRARFTGTDNLDHEIEQIPARDDFAQFAFGRDAREDHADSSNYVSPEVTGEDDLDEYGRWHYVAEYGPVWTPVAVAPGWAPYRYGHWVWVRPWGWTWVEDEPWGFAPFHYGRWALVEGGWCWVPGPVVVRPVFAPAFVAFVGGVGFGAGPAVAWFPLAPREVFIPWYRTSRVYVNRVNITNTRVNITNVTNVYNIYNTNTTNVTRVTYVNQRVNNGVTVVSRDTFVGGRPIATNLARVDARQVEAAPVIRRFSVQPVRQSVLGAGRPTAVRPAATVVNRQVVATRMPVVPRTPFEQRQNMNVRTETPSSPQPVGRTNPSPQPPRVNPRYEQQGTASRPQPPVVNNRPDESRSVPRPGNPRTEAVRPQQPARPPEPVNQHPLVRSAPPVQERPERQQSEERKFTTWQRQYTPPPRPEAAPRQPERSPQPQPQSQPRREEKPRK